MSGGVNGVVVFVFDRAFGNCVSKDASGAVVVSVIGAAEPSACGCVTGLTTVCDSVTGNFVSNAVTSMIGGIVAGSFCGAWDRAIISAGTTGVVCSLSGGMTVCAVASMRGNVVSVRNFEFVDGASACVDMVSE